MSHYQHLTINDREMILEGLAQSKTIREIAQKLKRAPPTIGQVQNVGVNLIPRIYHFTSLSIPASSELSSFSIPW